MLKAKLCQAQLRMLALQVPGGLFCAAPSQRGGWQAIADFRQQLPARRRINRRLHAERRYSHLHSGQLAAATLIGRPGMQRAFEALRLKRGGP